MWALILVTVTGLVCHAPQAPAADGESLEYAVKAAYLYKFGGYVEWPAATFASPESPVNLCIVGDDPSDDILDKTVAGKSIAGRPIALSRIKDAHGSATCQILYVSGRMDTDRVSQALATVRGTGVLTVTDAAIDVLAVIHFVIKDDRVRFTIDDRAAAANGLSISSHLLALALAVTPRS